MSTTNIIIGLVLGVLLAIAMILWRQRYRDVFAVLLVLGIAALAAVVTIVQVMDYREDRAVAASAAKDQPPPAEALAHQRSEARPWWPSPGGASGSAAPQAVESPYAGGSR